jgi:tRNA nucleotidyltransferase/poly(A) polymerase
MPIPWIPDEIAAAINPAIADGIGIWLVGGAVRDRLLNRPVKDFDFAVAGAARVLARSVADHVGGAYFELDAQRDAGRVLPTAGSTAQTIDFAALRALDIEDDLRLRDFTVNALAIDPSATDSILDPTGGLADLKERVLRLCHQEGIASDPVRSLRAVRLSGQLGFRMDSALVAALRADGRQVGLASVERIRDELFAILRQDRPVAPLRLAVKLGLLQTAVPAVNSADLERGMTTVGHLSDLMATVVGDFDPEAPGNFTLAQVSLQLGRYRRQMAAALDSTVAGDRRLRHLLTLASLLLPNAEGTEIGAEGRLASVADTIHLGRAELNLLAAIGAYASGLRPDELLPALDGRAQYRFRKALGEADVVIVLYTLAAQLSQGAGPPDPDQWERAVEGARAYLSARFERPSRLFPEPLVRGEDLMRALSIEPGPELGELLEVIHEAQAAGEVKTAEDALRLARSSHQSG